MPARAKEILEEEIEWLLCGWGREEPIDYFGVRGVPHERQRASDMIFFT